jgi:hypothetical protein
MLGLASSRGSARAAECNTVFSDPCLDSTFKPPKIYFTAEALFPQPFSVYYL